jgi:hypothetical protein
VEKSAVEKSAVEKMGMVGRDESDGNTALGNSFFPCYPFNDPAASLENIGWIGILHFADGDDARNRAHDDGKAQH